LAHLLQDKKIKDKQIQWVMLKAIGEAIITSAVPEEALMKIIPH
jgi:3-dehydroquinate synthetase